MLQPSQSVWVPIIYIIYRLWLKVKYRVIINYVWDHVRLLVKRVVTKQSSPATHHDYAWERGGIAPTHSWPQHWDGGEWLASRPGRSLRRGRDPRYPLYRKLGWPQSRSGHRGCRKNPLSLPGIEPLSPGRQSVVEHYTAWATPAP
jgi:hypothetical protein